MQETDKVSFHRIVPILIGTDLSNYLHFCKQFPSRAIPFVKDTPVHKEVFLLFWDYLLLNMSSHKEQLIYKNLTYSSLSLVWDYIVLVDVTMTLAKNIGLKIRINNSVINNL